MMIFLDPSFGGTPPKAQKVVLPTEDEGVYRIPLSLPVLAGGIYFENPPPRLRLCSVSIRIHPENALSPKTPRRPPWAGMRKDDNPLSDFGTASGAIFAQNAHKSFSNGENSGPGSSLCQLAAR
jgi:hypothetical protein